MNIRKFIQINMQTVASKYASIREIYYIVLNIYILKLFKTKFRQIEMYDVLYAKYFDL